MKEKTLKQELKEIIFLARKGIKEWKEFFELCEKKQNEKTRNKKN